MFEKIIYCVLIMISMVFGALTISRSFYVGVIILILLLIFLQNKELFGKKLILLSVASIIVYILYRYETDIIISIFEGLFERINSDHTGTGSRTLIWVSAFNCLQESMIGLMFGYGGNYTSSEFIVQNYFWLQAGLHNLYLDVMMSWGMIGSIAVIYIGVQMWRNLKNGKRTNSFSYIPLIILCYFAFTALRTTSLKPYIYFYVLMYYASETEEDIFL